MSLKEKIVTSSVEDVSLYLLERIKELESKDKDLSYQDEEQQKVQLISNCGGYVATLESNGKGGFYEYDVIDLYSFRYKHVDKPEDIKDIKWTITKDVDFLNTKLPIGDIVVKVGYNRYEGSTDKYSEILRVNTSKGYEPILSGTLKDKIIEIQKLVNTVTRVKPSEFEVIYTGLSTGEIKEPIVLYDDFIKASQDALKSSIDKSDNTEPKNKLFNLVIGNKYDIEHYNEDEYGDDYCDICGCEIDTDTDCDYICDVCDCRVEDYNLVNNPYNN